MTEFEKARHWRESMALSRMDLAKLTGYSREAVFLFERGANSRGELHDAAAWRRYKLACCAVRFLLHYKIADVTQWEWT